MKVIPKFLLASFFGFAIASVAIDKKVIASAISQIIKNHFAIVLSNLRIVKFVGNSTEIEDISNEVVRRSTTVSMTFEIIDLKKNQLIGYELNQSAILLFNDFNSLLEFYNSMLFRATNANTLNILAYYQFGSKKAWSTQGYKIYFNIAFLVKQNDRLELITHLYYTPGACRKLATKTINQFEKSEMKWKRKDFSPERFENLNGCEMSVAVREEFPYHWLDFHPDGSAKDAHGINIKLLTIIARKFNFSIGFMRYDVHSPRDFSLDIKSISNPHYSSRNYFLSHVYMYENIMFLVPPGELYTPVEKLFLPFDTATWICFITVFVVAMTVTVILKHGRDSPKEFVFGSNVKTPTIYLFQHFFGIGQKILPKTNFARFILMVFILYCLIMRTAYQGKLFEYLTSDGRKKGVQTIEEIIGTNMTLYLHVFFEDLINDMDVLKRSKIKFVQELEFEEFCLAIVKNPSFNGSVIVSSRDVDVYRWEYKDKFVMNVLDEQLFTIYSGLAFHPFHFLCEPFNDLISRIIESGIFDLWYRSFYHPNFFTWKPKKTGPIVLTLGHVCIGFYIWLISLGISSTCFVVEIIYKRFGLHSWGRN